jgi:ribonuclease BN (tRNA processing enzyme)
MKLRILGSGTSIPHPRRGTSGYACFAGDGRVLLLECGPGSTRRWPSAALDFTTVRTILVTHHHVDHCGDLPAVLFGRNVFFDADDPAAPPRVSLVLAGPVGHARHVRAIEELYGRGVVDAGGAVSVDELEDGDTRSYGPFRVDARVVHHTEHALGVRVTEGGATLAFSGDSGPCDALVDLCRGADLALLECSYPAAREARRHLNAATAAAVAIEAGVQRLVLTHFYPSCDGVDIEAEVRRAGYAGELSLASDGDELRI